MNMPFSPAEKANAAADASAGLKPRQQRARSFAAKAICVSFSAAVIFFALPSLIEWYDESIQ